MPSYGKICNITKLMFVVSNVVLINIFVFRTVFYAMYRTDTKLRLFRVSPGEFGHVSVTVPFLFKEVLPILGVKASSDSNQGASSPSKGCHFKKKMF